MTAGVEVLDPVSVGLGADEPAPVICPVDAAAFRRWLDEHPDERACWLVYWKQGSGRKNLTWSEAVDEALCVGWIDSQSKSLDAHRYRQRFTPRRPRSVWSKINKAKIDALRAAGRMAPAGEAAIAVGVANGSWESLTDVEDLVVPDDLAAGFRADPVAKATYDGLARWSRVSILRHLNDAKRPQTRATRLAAMLEGLAAGRNPRA